MIVREGSLVRRNETTGEGFVKDVTFLARSKRKRELWISRAVNRKGQKWQVKES